MSKISSSPFSLSPALVVYILSSTAFYFLHVSVLAAG